VLLPKLLKHMLQFVPWRQIADWRCTSCGSCCRSYSVVLNFPEWLRITQTFGSENTVIGLNKLFIKRSDDGNCAFLCRLGSSYLCALQSMKPKACMIWPFKLLTEPTYGEQKSALFDFAGKSLYIYADNHCNGLTYGSPSWEFSSLTLREFARIALGCFNVQHNSTRKSNTVFRF